MSLDEIKLLFDILMSYLSAQNRTLLKKTVTFRVATLFGRHYSESKFPLIIEIYPVVRDAIVEKCSEYEKRNCTLCIFKWKYLRHHFLSTVYNGTLLIIPKKHLILSY